MVKNKKTLKKTLEQYNKTTIVYGYTLFALTVVTFIITSLYPYTSALFQFSGPDTRYSLIITSILSFAAATILPGLASYLLGDYATHVKNRTLHHYNGVLFGFAAYWISMVFGNLGFQSVLQFGDSIGVSIVITNIVPVVLTLAVMVVLAVLYAKSNTKLSVMYYRPFQVVMIAATLALIASMFTTQTSIVDPVALIMVGLLNILVPVVPVLIGYRVLKNVYSTKLARLVGAIVAMYILWATGNIFASVFLALPIDSNVTSIVAIAAAAVVWVVYLVLSVRFAKK